MTTTERGNEFRDLVDSLLSAAGFRTTTEQLIGFKKVDLGALWERDTIEGTRRFAIEAKNYKGTLPIGQCNEFVAQYGALLERRSIDAAWLVSKGPISSHARDFVNSTPGLSAFTLQELMRRLLTVDIYLRDLVTRYETEEIGSYFIPPQNKDGKPLSKVVQTWLEDGTARPLSIFGSYGQGKTTFALNISYVLAARALNDPLVRVPIYIPLGEFVDEQSIEGLIGKVLASQYRVDGYHFQTFKTLNKLGMFLVIFDGLDEMKHGMSFPKFNAEINRLLELDDGNAKLVFLGRDTAIQSKYEFDAAVRGRSTTAFGAQMSATTRRAMQYEEIAGFSEHDSTEFVARYFPVCAKRRAEQEKMEVSDQWISARLNQLKARNFQDLANRPVHAQMLCEIATDAELDMSIASTFELYDKFVHNLIDREVRKRGRDSIYSAAQRRRFNAALAWWLWFQGGAQATSIASIPADLLSDDELKDELTSEARKRELVAGCLVQKDGDVIYFPHRSLQEFLVAEHFLLGGVNISIRREDGGKLRHILSFITPEVAKFITESGVKSMVSRREILTWISTLGRLQPVDLSLDEFALFVLAGRGMEMRQLPGIRRPIDVFIDFFLGIDGGSIELDAPVEYDRALQRLVSTEGGRTRTVGRLEAADLQIAVLHAINIGIDDGANTANFLARCLPAGNIAHAVGRLKEDSHYRHHIDVEAFPKLWMIWRSVVVVRRVPFRIPFLLSTFEVDWSELLRLCQEYTGVRLVNAAAAGADRPYRTTRCSGGTLVKAMQLLGVSAEVASEVIEFFANNKISPRVEAKRYSNFVVFD